MMLARTRQRTELKEFKFIVQPVLLVHVGGERIIDEQPADTVTLYGVKALRNFCDRFPAELKRLNSE